MSRGNSRKNCPPLDPDEYSLKYSPESFWTCKIQRRSGRIWQGYPECELAQYLWRGRALLPDCGYFSPEFARIQSTPSLSVIWNVQKK